ncbi:MAG TPA: DNA polymerase III subunit beta [Patescibacteria group bacterium]|nr:DNA polymerase III subunit beta [Patescibacteria group bacterium]
MRFICTKENLSYTLDLVSGVASKQANLPILLNIYIKAEESGVRLSATNLEVAIRANLRAKVERTGTFTIPAKTLTDFVHLLPEEQVELELEGNELKINCGTSSTKIKGMPADEYPVVPEVEENHAYAIKVDDLKKGLSQVVMAVAKNEIRPELAGVYLGFFTDRFPGLILAATDSYRLAEKKLEVAQGKDEVRCILPARAVYEMIRLLGLGNGKQGESQARLWVSDNQLALRYDDFEMTSRLIDGKYPEYSQIIPDKFKTTAILSLEEVVKKIKAASLFTTTGVNAVSFDINAGQGTLNISSTNTQTGEHASEIDADITGEENSILLNHRYVLDGLQNMDDDRVGFMVNSGDSPCLFKSQKDGDSFLYIVMPIRQ